MLPNQDQITAAGRTAMEHQFAAFSSLTNAAVESWGKLFDLNIHTAKTSLEESTVICRQLLEAKNPQEVFSFVTALLHPTAEKMVSYSRHVANIAAAAQTDIVKTAEAQITEANFRVASMVQEAARSAPPGAENLMAAVQTAMESASAGYQHIHRSAKQAADLAGANLNTAAEQFAQTTEKAGSAAKNTNGK